ncbi:MAG: hypothetical protein IJF84_11725 [Thermoguttaceae bacterium]|nr:hypothetical protein [Thermoguttaceae bacterium]
MVTTIVNVQVRTSTKGFNIKKVKKFEPACLATNSKKSPQLSVGCSDSYAVNEIQKITVTAK